MTESALSRWNELPAAEAQQEISACCGARRWAERMVATRPYSGIDDVLQEAADAWWALDPEDWLEAFSHHPRIGETSAASAGKRSLAWSTQEQAGVTDSEAAIREALADGNLEYEARFGHIYIVCASGKAAAEMLEILRRRLENDADTELREAAAQQAEITGRRLRKWLES